MRGFRSRASAGGERVTVCCCCWRSYQEWESAGSRRRSSLRTGTPDRCPRRLTDSGPPLAAAFDRAFSLAQSSGHNPLGTDHVLAGLAADEDGISNVLGKHGVRHELGTDRAALRTDVPALLH